MALPRLALGEVVNPPREGLPQGLPLLPGANLGVLGGGQLGRMFVQAAQRLGYATTVLDPDDASPAGRVAEHHVQAAYLDDQGLARLAGLAGAFTTEFENVPAAALQRLAAQGPTAPSHTAVAIAQDRFAEKQALARSGVPCAPHARIETDADLARVDPALLPGILKTARLGYDGKGQARVAHIHELAAAWADLGRVPCVLEQRLPLAAELSIVAVRGFDGQAFALPAQRNTHRDGILAVTEVFDGNLPRAGVEQAQSATINIANALDYVGVLCVEFFLLEPGSATHALLGGLVANEMAPRPHNSGHWSQDGSDVSQFEWQVRAMAGLPLAAPHAHSPTIMLNLLGDLWFRDGPQHEPDWPAVLAIPGAHLHLYGKAQPRPGRKMGHLNLTGPDIPTVVARTRAAASVLGLQAALPDHLGQPVPGLAP